MRFKTSLLSSLLVTIVTTKANSFESCTHQLQSSSWPIDCLLELKVKNASPTHPFYSRLNSWCLLKTDALAKTPPPKVLTSLSPPKDCLRIARERTEKDQAAQLIRGDFLNSFP